MQPTETPQAAATARMLTAAQPFCWISSRLVFRMSALDVAIGFVRSPPNMNAVHDAQYTTAVGRCQGENKNFFVRSLAGAQGQIGAEESINDLILVYIT